MGDWQRLFTLLGMPVKMAQTGCCGMSGLFGHESCNQDWSRKLYDMSWRAVVDGAEELAATGFSCRCQVKRFGGKAVTHPMALIAGALTRGNREIGHAMARGGE
jgi:Fe-S oxidoreductase